VVLAVAACGPAVPPPVVEEPPREPTCDELAHSAHGRAEHGDVDGAIADYRRGLPRCEESGFHYQLGVALAARDRIDEAAAELIAELHRAVPVEATTARLSGLLDRLSDARRTELTRLGGSKDSALRIPDPYAWIERFPCAMVTAGRVTRRGQSQVEHRGRKLDVLLFTCPDGVEHMIYFEAPK
jgi:hypothetical protein